MNLYTVVTGEIREGDLFYDDIHFAKAELKPCKKTVGFDANDLSFPIFRPVKVPSEEEFIKAMNIPNSLVNRDVVLRGRKTMLRLMGLEPEQAKEVEG